MSEDQTKGPTTTALVEVPQKREIRVVEHTLPMWDTAAFEHLGRVATVMASAALLPETLTHTGPAASREPLPFDTVRARALLIANQARLWDMDPIAVAQSTSLVHNRLMYEGKLVHAVVEKRVSIRLRYLFGVWETDHIALAENPDLPPPGAGERLAVRVLGRFPDEDFDRSIEGSVGMWKTSGNNSPWSPTAYPRQLRYRGAREWARAHSPGILLGVVTDDEIDEAQLVAESRRVAAPPGAMRLSAGVEVDAPRLVAPAEAEPAPEPDKPRRGRKAKPEAEPHEHEGLADHPDEVKVRPTDGAEATGTDGAPAAEPEPATSETAALASADTAEASSSPKASEEPMSGGAAERPLEEGPAKPEADASGHQPPEDVVSEGYPEKDQVYHLTGDAWEWDESRGDFVRDTYKNGEPFSSSKHSSGYSMYEDHRPEGALTPEEPAPAAEAPAAPAGEQDPVDRYIEEVEAAKTWHEIKAAMQWFLRSDTFTKLAPDEQAAFRAKTWEFASALTDVEDQAQSPTAFRLWIEFIEDADAIEGTLRILEKAPAFEGMQPSQKDGIRKAAAGRMEALRRS